MLQPLNLTRGWSRSSTRHPLASLSPTWAQHCPITAQSLDMAQVSLAGTLASVRAVNVPVQVEASNRVDAALPRRLHGRGSMV